ncbi:nucleotidyltransferase [Sphingopyxis sp. GW247-27LB]|uniref:SMODS domain-containing nucleotidyltransferase n=1 Tax=Sphingopyxis sp. GW247-27LB TaxID=2012632 RepID=UPI000BA540DD|nr:nucleotidyltransferase [Sphingopyxis sp. GW247-27LB]PAL20656.1 nucleotidyltransferase [Sphingopyxis sp. GW247-27LB]
MKLVPQFSDFLRDTVNLNATRIGLLEKSVDAIKDFVRQCEWDPRVRGFEEQGSWAHDTIIRPLSGGEFDADLLVKVAPVSGWTAKDYVKKLGEAFADSATYGSKCKTWDYCVTVTYAGERKIDIAPLVMDRKHAGSLEVCNRLADEFEDSEPMHYTVWLRDKNLLSGSNSFRKVTRLLKYLRDIKTTFTCPSVLLTTLLGMQIDFHDKDTEAFADVPTTLRTLMRRLDDWLQARPVKPRVENPHLRSEDFAAGWTDLQYANFRSFIHKYRGWIDEAYDMEGKAASILAWRKIFGDGFAKGETAIAAASINEGTSLIATLLSTTAAHLDGIVDAVRRYGLSILPGNFNRPPHMEEPAWRREAVVSTDVAVIARRHRGRDSAPDRLLRSGDIVSRDGGIWFEATVNGGQPVPDGFRVQWRITNTGAMALRLNNGRGKFYAPTRQGLRWEELQYRGIHIAEAFIIRVRDDVLVGQSPPFNVVIE